jgi:parallel beta-helix repeat protein
MRFRLVKRRVARTAARRARKHLQSYLDEFVFRFNRRRTRHAAVRSLLGIGAGHAPLSCKVVISPERIDSVKSSAPLTELHSRFKIDCGILMRRPAAFVPIVLAVAAIILAPAAGAPEQDTREQGPTKIKRCQTIDQPGSYKLVNNLNATGNCLVITTEGVTVDLGGFAITGDGTGTAMTGPPAPMETIPQTRTIVRNGDISHFALATNLSGTVEGLRVTSNGKGIFVAVGIVRGNTAQFNGSAGIGLVDGVVTGNLVVANDTGIFVEEAGVITGNQAAGNKIGIDVRGTGSTLISNIADGNSEIGLRVGCPSNLSQNTAVGNGTNLVLNGTTCHNEDNVAP